MTEKGCIDRRRFALSTGGALLGIAAKWTPAAYALPNTVAGPVVRTEYGRLRGSVANGVVSFRGIPYGASTAGTRRFLPPAAPKSWGGIRNAYAFGPPCYQPAGSDPGIWDDPLPQSEDCLHLNVQTKAADTQKRPVMVWLHGGANLFGSGGIPGYDGTNLVNDENVVVVTVNHRLGVFGFLFLGDVIDDRYRAGNPALQDIIAALKWVRNNIAAFGGDPQNVTVFGESAGGANISTLLAVPAAKGLFHKAIVQSGAAPRANSREEATAGSSAVLGELGLRKHQLGRLQEISPQSLMQAFSTAGKCDGLFCSKVTLTRGVIDGLTLARQPCDPDFPSESADVPLLISTTGDEFAYFLTLMPDFVPATDDGELVAQMSKINPIFSPVEIDDSVGRQAIALARSEDSQLGQWAVVSRIMTDATLKANATRMAERRLAQSAAPTVFVAEFRWQVPCKHGMYAFHGVDVPLMFNHPEIAISPDMAEMPVEWQQVESKRARAVLARRCTAAWAAFARNGNPSTPELPWPAYDLQRRQTMILSHDPVVLEDPRREMRQLFANS
jgi:para-nitrobenzyl esterase